ncbi:unnamed protein product, partial [Effrenium voratum]
MATSSRRRGRGACLSFLGVLALFIPWPGTASLAFGSAPLGAGLGRRGLLGLVPAAGADDGKKRNLDASEMAKIVRQDLVERQFLATADFSPEIYDESCTFTDEIDSYQKDKFIKGTKALQRSRAPVLLFGPSGLRAFDFCEGPIPKLCTKAWECQPVMKQ